MSQVLAARIADGLPLWRRALAHALVVIQRVGHVGQVVVAAHIAGGPQGLISWRYRSRRGLPMSGTAVRSLKRPGMVMGRGYPGHAGSGTGEIDSRRVNEGAI